jgi:hypothetical protein
LHQRIRLQEAAQRGIIKARPVVIQAQIRFPPLPREPPVREEGLYFP